MAIDNIPAEMAWLKLRDDPHAVLVDVRCRDEWKLIGIPDLSKIDKTPIFIEWQSSNGMFNSAFLDQLREQAKLDDTLVMLCRSGKRSMMAAMLALEAGYSVINVADGFEGDPNTEHQRKIINGWCAAKLPWRYE